MRINRDAKNIIVGMDIGTSKIVTIVGEIMPEGLNFFVDYFLSKVVVKMLA